MVQEAPPPIIDSKDPDRTDRSGRTDGSRAFLTVILCLTGLALAAIGLNTALDGMVSLGWQFSPNILTITDPDMFSRHDNNARFFAGVFTGFGCVMALSAFNQRLRFITVALLLCIAVGGFFRLLQPDYAPYSDLQLLPSLLAELVFGPLLAIWILRTQH